MSPYSKLHDSNWIAAAVTVAAAAAAALQLLGCCNMQGLLHSLLTNTSVFQSKAKEYCH
jgi:hypothetical protein